AYVTYARAKAADRAAGTRTARWIEVPAPQPVVRAEFILTDSQAWPHSWIRHELAQPFYAWDRQQHGHHVGDRRSIEIGYLTLGPQTLARTSLLVLREGRTHWKDWPGP